MIVIKMYLQKMKPQNTIRIIHIMNAVLFPFINLTFDNTRSHKYNVSSDILFWAVLTNKYHPLSFNF
jgi:hypothetical protein